MDILAKDDPTAMPSAFKAEIIKTRKDHRDLMKVKYEKIESSLHVCLYLFLVRSFGLTSKNERTNWLAASRVAIRTESERKFSSACSKQQ
jgi:hypothetical protein